jgi:NAD(P)H-dependent FMN reductase
MPMKLLMMAASSRKASVNKKLIQLAAKLIQTQAEVRITEFADYDVPLYNGDINEQQGLPANAKKFIQDMNAVDGIIFAVPEYNFSIPGNFKNLIDWVSRDKPMPWAGKQILLMSASPSLVGGNRGLWHTRVPLEACGSFVYPEMFSLANAYNAFNPDGNLTDGDLQKRLAVSLENFGKYLQKLKS